MTAVAQIVRDALSILRVVDAREAPEAEDEQDGIRALNLMMRAWEADGLNLGWSDVSNPADELPIPPENEEAITYNLAKRLQSRYGVSMSVIDLDIANQGLASISAQVTSADYSRIEYPDLPTGQGQRVGNWRDGFNC
ncbi:packaged DNA stabilization gp4 family protein [Stenotrophomonas sp.]|uniref:packaged DNA stabilization gp4 family protein n=1 Tax=Stenotrophomonas sp. TaxID=69392 RepID=UPI00289E7560|nr:packaged DNA stabilization gp4 family protein [Stenotrophomonas sp.]